MSRALLDRCVGVPSPLAGEGQGGGCLWATVAPLIHTLSMRPHFIIYAALDWSQVRLAIAATPLPNPPPQGGREHSCMCGCTFACSRRAEGRMTSTLRAHWPGQQHLDGGVDGERAGEH